MFDSRYYAMVFTKSGELLYECFGFASSDSSARYKAEALFNEKAHYVPSLKKHVGNVDILVDIEIQVLC